MEHVRRDLAALLALVLCLVGDVARSVSWPTPGPAPRPRPDLRSANVGLRTLAQTPTATPASPEVVAELAVTVARARERFEARDAAGVLAHVSDRYRSGGFTKTALSQQLFALFALYDQMRAPVRVDHVQMVDGTAWFFTTGEVSGYLPLLGWVTVLSWERQPEVARREGAAWRLFGFQD